MNAKFTFHSSYSVLRTVFMTWYIHEVTSWSEFMKWLLGWHEAVNKMCFLSIFSTTLKSMRVIVRSWANMCLPLVNVTFWSANQHGEKNQNKQKNSSNLKHDHCWCVGCWWRTERGKKSDPKHIFEQTCTCNVNRLNLSSLLSINV